MKAAKVTSVLKPLPCRLLVGLCVMNSAIQSPGKKYQRFVSLCLHEARATTDFKLKSLLVEMAQTWQRLADQAKAQRALPKIPTSEPDRGD